MKKKILFAILVPILAVGIIVPVAAYANPIHPPIDIKPTSCPNPLNVRSGGVLPVAILGTASFDVTNVDTSTILLEGVAPLHWSYEDVATPDAGEPCCDDCTTDGPDGYTDLTLKFDKEAIVAALGTVTDGECVELTLTGNLLIGTPIEATDCVIIIKKGNGP